MLFVFTLFIILYGYLKELSRKTLLTWNISKGELQKPALNLVVNNPKCSNFYILPKHHKLGNPGRPVVSSCSCSTTLTSKYLSEFLKPIVMNLPSFVKDTNHALKLM